mmetsp:Transcript_29473/g.77934  ORF Transcript_29473/g.77934 Transcript_29473/m.77934 type:complete len:261 (+) Transcript_29473:170-952(+)
MLPLGRARQPALWVDRRLRCGSSLPAGRVHRQTEVHQSVLRLWTVSTFGYRHEDVVCIHVAVICQRGDALHGWRQLQDQLPCESTGLDHPRQNRKVLRSLRFFLPSPEEAVERFAWKLGHGEAHAADLRRDVGDLRPHVLGYSDVKTRDLCLCAWRTLHRVAQTLDELRLVEGTGKVHLRLAQNLLHRHLPNAITICSPNDAKTAHAESRSNRAHAVANPDSDTWRQFLVVPYIAYFLMGCESSLHLGLRLRSCNGGFWC